MKRASEAHALFNEIQITQITRAMQSADISLETAVLLIDSLKKLFSQYRENGFEKPVTDARLLANECDASTEFAQKHNRKRKTFHDEVNAAQPGRPTSFQTNGVVCNC